MEARFSRKDAKQRIRHRIRKKVQGTANRPRLAVFRSLKHTYAQAVDDETGKTVAFASTRDKNVLGSLRCGSNIDAAKQVGQAIAERLKASGVETIVFDRGGFAYHGRVKAVAEAAREGGLKF